MTDFYPLKLFTKCKKKSNIFSTSIFVALLTEGLILGDITTNTSLLELDSPVGNQRTPLNSDKTNTFDPATEY